MSDEHYLRPLTRTEHLHQKSFWGCVGKAALAIFVALVAIAFLLPLDRGREAARRSFCRNNLKQIGLALHNYHETYHSFPPAYTVNEEGQRLHSWRTLILPFIDGEKIYNQIDLTKPWDDPVNEAARNQTIPAYRCLSGEMPDYHTNYLAVVGPGTCFRGSQSCSLSDITDAHADTLLLMEFSTHQAVHWMSPQDADEAQLMTLGKGKSAHLAHEGGMNAVFADGSGRFLDNGLPTGTRHAILTISGGEPVKW